MFMNFTYGSYGERQSLCSAFYHAEIQERCSVSGSLMLSCIFDEACEMPRDFALPSVPPP